MGSFFNVVGSRMARGESIVKPRSHCGNCKHELGALELIPILSFLFQGGRCKKCKTKLSWFYPMYEFFTGLLYALCFYQFGFTIELAIALTFVSTLLIVFVSDYEEMIILDEVLIIGIILLMIEYIIKDGVFRTMYYLLDGCVAFGVMYLLKLFGDHLFHKDSMGGGDIKLLFLFGFVLGYPMAIVSIFLGSLIGLPVALIVTYCKNTNIIAFGPFLILGAFTIFFTGMDWNQFIHLLIK